MRKKEHIFEEFLVASAKLGDQRSLSSLVELRGPKLLAHATRLLGNSEQAKDVVQEAWVEILKGLPKLNEDRAFASWAYRITSRRCSKLIKSLQTQRNIKEVTALSAENSVPDRGGDTADAHVVRMALDALPPEQRATVALFYLEEMSIGEAALALDIPAGTVKTRLMHARSKLKDILKGKLDE